MKFSTEDLQKQQNASLFQNDKDLLIMAKVVSLVLAILGFTMAIINSVEQNTTMVFTSLVYGPVFLITFFVTQFSKKINFFLIVGFILSYAMEILYLITGGQDGFGIYWMLIITFFTFFINTNKVFFTVNSFYIFFIFIAFWSPLSKYCYQFSTTTKIRFPMLYLIEIIFAACIKLKLGKTEIERSKLIYQLLDLRNSLSEQVEERTEQLKKEKDFSNTLLIEVTQALATTIDAKDKYTSGHSRRVAEYSQKIAQKIGFSIEEQQKIYIIALLHDIGKIGIPDEIINKRDALTKEEYDIVKKHPEIGYEILKNITTLPDFEIGVRWHHERFDGNGYPDHLKNDQIPLYAQIISVADSYDAMTSNRSYRTYLPQEKVRSELENGKGKQFAPEIATMMIKLIDEDTSYVMHE